MTLYEFNQIGMANFPDFKEEDFLKATEEFESWIKNNSEVKYYMLLNKENSYYTLFNIQSSFALKDVSKTMFKELCECLQTFGTIKSIDLTEDKTAFEIWVKDRDEKTFMFLLFPYDLGVIKI